MRRGLYCCDGRFWSLLQRPMSLQIGTYNICLRFSNNKCTIGHIWILRHSLQIRAVKFICRHADNLSSQAPPEVVKSRPQMDSDDELVNATTHPSQWRYSETNLQSPLYTHRKWKVINSNHPSFAGCAKFVILTTTCDVNYHKVVSVTPTQCERNFTSIVIT